MKVERRPSWLALACAFAAVWPWRALAALGRAVGFLAGNVLRIRRRSVVAALARAGVAEPERAATAMYAGLGASLLELLWLGGRSAPARARAIAAHGALSPGLARAIDEAQAAGRPVVLAASHTGNWELVAFTLAQAFAARARSVSIVVKPISARAVDVFCTGLREGAGVTLLAPQGALRNAQRALASGGAVTMVIDQVPDRSAHGLRVPFLGAAALADRSPATLALRTRATMLVIAARRPPAGGVQVVELLATLVPPPPGDPARATFVDEATRVAQTALDGFVRAHPSSWLWLHRRWRAPRAELAAVDRASQSRLVATGQRG